MYNSISIPIAFIVGAMLMAAGLSAGAVVGISITIFLVSFSAGAMLATLIIYCCGRGKRKKSHQQEHSSSESPQPAPVYAEVVPSRVEMKENPSYEFRLTMKNNPSYGHVGQ